MSKIEKVVNANEIYENESLTRSLFNVANEQGSRYFSFRENYYIHHESDKEGIYKVTVDGVSDEIRRLYSGNVKSAMSIMTCTVTNFYPPTLEQLAERQTGDGRKFYKAFNQALKKYQQESKDGSKEVVTGILQDFIKEFERLDQKGLLGLQESSFYARLSFRNQDVLGMTALGTYKYSCQDIVARGFDNYATSALASMLSHGVGTLTLHETLDGALDRDQAETFRDIHELAFARDNVIRDTIGQVTANDSEYYSNPEGRAKLIETKNLMRREGILVSVDELETVSITEVSNEDSNEYLYEGEMEYIVDLAHIGEDKIKSYLIDGLQDVLDNNELDESETAELEDAIESDDLDTLLETATEWGIDDNIKDELMELIDVSEFDTERHSYTFQSYEGYEYEVSDEEVVAMTDYTVIQEETEEYFNYNCSLDDMIELLIGGRVHIQLYVSFDYEAVDYDSTFTPYLEGNIDRVRTTVSYH